MKLLHVRLPVDDFPGCFRFLRDDLWLACTVGAEDDAYASFAAGDGTSAVCARAGQDAVVGLRPAGDAALVVLGVDDVDAESHRLGALVVAGPSTTSERGGQIARVRDPDGNLFELLQTMPTDAE